MLLAKNGNYGYHTTLWVTIQLNRPLGRSLPSQRPDVLFRISISGSLDRKTDKTAIREIRLGKLASGAEFGVLTFVKEGQNSWKGAGGKQEGE